MEHIHFHDNKLTLTVGKSPLYTRFILFPLTFLTFLLPIGGIALNISEGNGISFFSIILLALFSLLGFHLLRISLWNTFGKEVIEIAKEKITYMADYGWFKDKIQEIPFEDINCSIKQNEFDDTGVLLFKSEKAQIESVVPLPVSELEILLIHINSIIPQR